MGRTSNQDLLKALKMVARGMDEHKAWVTCNQPTTWGNAQRVFKEARKQREAAPATVNKLPPTAAAARGSWTAPTAPAAAKRGAVPDTSRVGAGLRGVSVAQRERKMRVP